MTLKRINLGISSVFVASLALIAPATAFSQSKDELNVASLAASCAACHGTQGKAVAVQQLGQRIGLGGIAQARDFGTGEDVKPATRVDVGIDGGKLAGRDSRRLRR